MSLLSRSAPAVGRAFSELELLEHPALSEASARDGVNIPLVRRNEERFDAMCLDSV